jgi:hypothetical protein
MYKKNLLIIGGNNDIGVHIVEKFRTNWRVVNIDF